MDKFFQKVFDQVKLFLSTDSSGHDIYHCERVLNVAMYIQKLEGGDEKVIGISALVHDICRPWEKKTGKSHFGDEASGIISSELEKIGIEEDLITKVLEVVKLHDIYDWIEKIPDKSIELQIVQDADNLDAIGAIGIARTFSFGGAYGREMYLPGENLDFREDYQENPASRTSTIAHFYEKLLKLKDNMNTKTGKKMAANRHNVMEDFLDQFFNEWNGKE